MYTNHKMIIASFAVDEQFICAITPGSVIDGDADDNYSIKPDRLDS